MSPQIIQILAGTSSVLGLLAVLAYFVFQMQTRTAERSVRQIVEGDPLFDAEQVVKLLAQFSDDERRLKALELLSNHDRSRAKRLLNKIKDDVDVNRLNKIGLEHQYRSLLVAAAVLIALGLIGFAYSRFGDRPPKSEIIESPTAPRSEQEDSVAEKRADQSVDSRSVSSVEVQPAPGESATAPSSQSAYPSSLVTFGDVVLDRISGLLWLKDTFRLGCTDVLFAKSNKGTASAQADYTALKLRVQDLSLSDITGWRIANESEINALARNSGASLFTAFAVHRIREGATNLIGIYQSGPATFVPWGYQHDDYLHGPLTWGFGAYAVNEYGVWIVSGPVSADWKHPSRVAGAEVTAPPEKRIDTLLRPVLPVQMKSKNGATTADWLNVANARVGNLDGEERFAAEFDFRVIPSGALVRAELGLDGQWASGEDPVVTINVYKGTGVVDEASPMQWSPRALDTALKWNYSPSARLALPEQVVRNARNTRDIVGVQFKYGGKLGNVNFFVPSLTVTYVPEADLLSKRELSYANCGS